MTQPTLRPFSTFIDIIRRLASEQPNRTAHSSYFYVWDELGNVLPAADRQPDCIGGHAYAELGAVSKTQPEGPNGVAEVVAVGDTRVVREGYGIGDTNWTALGIQAPNFAQREWVIEVQRWQDGRGPDHTNHLWSGAVEKADQSLNELQRAQLSE